MLKNISLNSIQVLTIGQKMGFDLQSTRFVSKASVADIDFIDAGTIGRQNPNIDSNAYRVEAKRFVLEATQDGIE
jgi:hypothetical protein